ncbi:hypothetical protein CTAYLR_000230 [Chrysophaeum taylorii]|uniref:Uncharacterized protein n=1 Tax=Chrysophaeum taylorii TaxID=2483200 RepID=A0AAD7UEH0_9STRA|nr:hypothetical protein CTAYLR_000230 [Chrysophaeum taylorii]
MNNSETSSSSSLLFLEAARYGDLEDVIAMLDEDSTYLDVRGPGGNTALHAAAATGHEEITKFLLSRGADATVSNEAGNTPAHYAAQQRQLECLKLILSSQGVDVLVKNEFGRSVLTEAIASGDGALAAAALEHPTATEDRIIEGVVPSTGGPASVEHDLDFGRGTIRVREIQIAKTVEDTFADGDKTGLGVWSSSLVLARWLTAEAKAFEGRRVVELGAGCGVASLALASAAQKARVRLTDANSDVLENAKFNVRTFLENHPAATIEVGRLDWNDHHPPAPADVVIGADLVYCAEAATALANAVANLAPDDFWYVSPATGRAGADLLLATLADRFGFVLASRDAPPAYYANPLLSADDDAFLVYFPDMPASVFRLHHFQRPHPPPVENQP